jgi:hypothetical protein
MLNLIQRRGGTSPLPSRVQIASIEAGSDEQRYLLDTLAAFLPTDDAEERHPGKGYRWIYDGTFRDGNGAVRHRMVHRGRPQRFPPLPGRAPSYGSIAIDFPASEDYGR